MAYPHHDQFEPAPEIHRILSLSMDQAAIVPAAITCSDSLVPPDLQIRTRGWASCGRTQRLYGTGSFVGPAGHLLDDLLASIGLQRQDVYITNMIKCRAPNNRDPLPGEIEACKPYLDRQLEMIAPKVIVTLGRFSFSKFFPDEAIGKARGKPRRWKGMTLYPIYHPAAALHNPQLRSTIESDFKRLPALLEQTVQSPEEPEEPVEQLSMF